jgi:hypothetical protein
MESVRSTAQYMSSNLLRRRLAQQVCIRCVRGIYQVQGACVDGPGGLVCLRLVTMWCREADERVGVRGAKAGGRERDTVSPDRTVRSRVAGSVYFIVFGCH